MQLQRAGIYRQKGDLTRPARILDKLEEQSQPQRRVPLPARPACYLAEGERAAGGHATSKRAVELDPGHTGALFQLGHANDLAGNDDEAIDYYERCLEPSAGPRRRAQ